MSKFMGVREIIKAYRDDDYLPQINTVPHIVDDDILCVSSPDRVKDFANYIFDADDSVEEYCWALFTDANNKIIFFTELSHGVLNYAFVDMKILFLKAILCGCSGIVLVHNHPSGDPSPSHDDDNLTENAKKCCGLLGYEFLDHVIVSNTAYYSYKEAGRI